MAANIHNNIHAHKLRSNQTHHSRRINKNSNQYEMWPGGEVVAQEEKVKLPTIVADGALEPKRMVCDLEEGWENKMIEAGRHGAHLATLLCALGCTKEEHRRFLLDDHYARCYQISYLASEAYWESIGRSIAISGSTPGWARNMMQKFAWSSEGSKNSSHKTAEQEIDTEDLTTIANEMGLNLDNLGAKFN